MQFTMHWRSAVSGATSTNRCDPRPNGAAASNSHHQNALVRVSEINGCRTACQTIGTSTSYTSYSGSHQTDVAMIGDWVLAVGLVAHRALDGF